MQQITERSPKKKPIISEITSLLKTEVTSGKWNPDQPISTDKELAKRLGVSRSTIVKSLAQLQREGYIWSRQGKGRFVHEQFQGTNAIKSWNIGVVIADMSHLVHPIVTARLAGINRVLQSTQYHLQILALNGNSDQKLSLVTKNANLTDMDGVIVCTQPLPLDEVNGLASKMPLVWIDPPIDNPEIGTINLDFLGGAFVAGKHLVELGHKKIALIGGDPKKYPVLKIQQEGLRLSTWDNAKDNGDVASYTAFVGKEFTVEEGRKLTEEMLQSTPRPTAVICGSDEYAIGAYKVFKAHGLKIPEDISLIAWSDTELEKQIPIPLTAISIDYEEVGQRSIELLLSKIDNPKEPFQPVTIPMKLMVRESTAAPKHNIPI